VPACEWTGASWQWPLPGGRLMRCVVCVRLVIPIECCLFRAVSALCCDDCHPLGLGLEGLVVSVESKKQKHFARKVEFVCTDLFLVIPSILHGIMWKSESYSNQKTRALSWTLQTSSRPPFHPAQAEDKDKRHSNVGRAARVGCRWCWSAPHTGRQTAVSC